ncbi:MAG: EAL domain-containing protein [Burkholderiaceae bacterium]|nr:EAL domain-containing protein [Burkholderiaceae bacterium]
MSPRLPLPGRLGFAVIGLFALLCLALVGWNHLRWTTVLEAALAPQQQLAAAQAALHRAQLSAEQLRGGDPQVDAALLATQLQQAREAARRLMTLPEGPSERGLPDDLRQGHAAVLQQLGQALAELEAAVEVRAGDAAASPATALHAAHERVEAAAQALEQHIHREQQQRLRHQAHSTALTLLLVAALAAALMLWMYRTLREREAASARLAANEAQLEAIFAALPEVSFLLDDQGRYLGAWGPDEKFALPRERLQGLAVTDHLEPAQAAEVLATIRRALTTGQPAQMEIDLHTPAGPRSFEGRAAALAGQARVVWISWDITERKAAQARMRLHAAALESTQDGVMVTDLDGRIVSVNRAFTEITGYPEPEVIGRRPGFLQSGRHDAAFYAGMWQELLREGRWQGEMWNRRRDGQLYAQWMSVAAVQDAEQRRSHYVAVFTDTTAHKIAERRLQELAHYDLLTRLPNRAMVLARLEQALAAAERAATRMGVLFIDLDNFKTVNDSLGHDAGDQLLQAVAQRLQQRVRREDTLGRLGGDEFVLVMEHLREAQDAGPVAQGLLDLLEEPFEVAGTPVYVQASVGISLYPEDGASVAELIRDADAAMYQAKRAGRSTYRFYTEAMTLAAQQRLALDTRLRRALERGEFSLWYQPLYRLSDRRLVGLEALVRLHQPDLPPIGPELFIPLLEETGQIVALGQWVTAEACRQGRAWLDEGLDFGRIAVNLSPVEVRRGGSAERLGAALAASGLPPQRLELEITESGLMEQGEHAEAFLRALHARGVHLAIDDFGTGYSSLAYLKRFPVGKLKIDRSFVADLPGDVSDAQLVQTMVTLGRSLGMAVLAEGVESPGQLDFLTALGCEAAQGFLFSAPQPAEQVGRLLPQLEALPA